MYFVDLITRGRIYVEANLHYYYYVLQKTKFYMDLYLLLFVIFFKGFDSESDVLHCFMMEKSNDELRIIRANCSEKHLYVCENAGNEIVSIR